MAVLYKGENPLDIDPRIEKWYQRLHKYHLLVPFFPKDVDHQDRWWYKLGYTSIWFSSIWFYLLMFYFLYLAGVNKWDWYYLAIAGGWLFFAVFLPAGIYRITIYYLMLRKRIY